MRLVAMRGLRLAATRKIAISEPAMHEIAGDGWQADPTASILLYGFDFSRNEGAAERVSALREQLNIPTDAKVIGHIGRFAPVKNHDFLLRVFGEFAKTEKRAHLVMVGQGELEPDIRALADELGLSSRVRFAGTSDDIPAFLSLFDLFLFPSFSEGLGIVCLEAQAAGTPSLVSTGIPEEVVVIPGAVEKLPLDSGVAQWAAAVERLMRSPPLDTGTWRSRVEESEYGIRRCVRDLNTIYRQELGRLQ